MSKYFDKKVPKNMFFNIFCLFFDFSDSKMSLVVNFMPFCQSKGKVARFLIIMNCELRIVN